VKYRKYKIGEILILNSDEPKYDGILVKVMRYQERAFPHEYLVVPVDKGTFDDIVIDGMYGATEKCLSYPTKLHKALK
jgi:hypothetical protein